VAGMEKKNDLAEPTKNSNAKKRKKKGYISLAWSQMTVACNTDILYAWSWYIKYGDEYVFQDLLYLYYEYTGYDQIQYVFF